MNQEITVNLEGNWGIYTCSIPQGATPLGTVTRKGYDTGALVRLAGGQVVQVNTGIVRRLPPDALEQAEAGGGTRSTTKLTIEGQEMNITEEHKAQAKQIREMLENLDPRVRYYLATHLQVEENVYDSAEEAAEEVESYFDDSPTVLEDIDLVLFLKPVDIKYITADNFEIIEGETP